VPTLAWQPCGANLPGIQCATAKVPLDYDHAGGATIGIALARRPATDAAHRIGTLFVNPGGPGGSGVDLVKGGFGGYLADQLHGRFDVVGFDPRGAGASNPLRCFASAEDDARSSRRCRPCRTKWSSSGRSSTP
jgi:pimeloyl-ACP methyl ester carboxylesterase